MRFRIETRERSFREAKTDKLSRRRKRTWNGNMLSVGGIELIKVGIMFLICY
jgi:hypothetical protein